MIVSLNKPESIFMIGIGGMGMAPLAIYLSQAGHSISGSDLALKPQIKRLLDQQGIGVHAHHSLLPDGIDRVIYSNAVSSTAALLVEASRRGIPTVKRGEFLAQLAKQKRFLAVVGAHGKTTTTGLLITALRAQQFSFDYILGGLFSKTSNWFPAQYCDSSSWLIAEVDESDGTIDKFSPEITLAVNWDWDHPDFYKSREASEGAIFELFKRTQRTILVPDKGILPELASQVSASVHTFGEKGDFVGRCIHADAQGIHLELGGAFCISQASVPAPGTFNVENALAALSAAQCLKPQLNSEPLTAFPGLFRRQNLLYQTERINIYSDYAHHPTELAALITFARSAYPNRQCVFVFEPHRYSRTLHYKEVFAKVLLRVDQLFLLPVYAAGEASLPGGNREDLLQALSLCPNRPTIEAVDSLEQLLNALPFSFKHPTLLFFVGAGNIDQWASSYCNQMIVQEWAQLSNEMSAPTHLSVEEPLANKTTLRLGGAARFYAEPGSLDDLRHLLHWLRRHGLDFFILGRGSNTIVPDDGYAGLAIRLNQSCWKRIELVSNALIEVGAGTRLKHLCGETSRLGLTGFEFLEGIPGSLGGALRMNAGAMGNWIFDRVESVQLLTKEGELLQLSRTAFSPNYRECRELKETVVLKAIFRAVSHASPEAIRAKMQAHARKRNESQPVGANAGCMFKNPRGISAGALIDDLGLKGCSKGGAQISTKHANFILNQSQATASQVIHLMDDIRQEVKRQRKITLEPEVILMGQEWEEVISQN